LTVAVVATTRALQVVVHVGEPLFSDTLTAALSRRGIPSRAGILGRIPADTTVMVVDAATVDEAALRSACVGLDVAIVLLGEQNLATRQLARRLDAAACIGLDVSLRLLADIILDVAAGNAVRPGSMAATPPASLDGLTPREADVLRLLAAGHDNDTIARNLSISPHTVRTHVQRIMGKFRVGSRFAAVSEARTRGLLTATFDS
jgi:DNA-binding NarL/FixJ family response regulator